MASVCLNVTLQIRFQKISVSTDITCATVFVCNTLRTETFLVGIPEALTISMSFLCLWNEKLSQISLMDQNGQTPNNPNL